jgi:hypothetical protein
LGLPPSTDFKGQGEFDMAEHGYLREYDEDWDDRDRWRDEDRERGWRERGWSDRGDRGDRNFMFGDRDRQNDRGFFDRLGDRARDMFRDDDRHSGRDEWRGSGWGSSGYGREHGFGGYQGDYGRSGRDQGGFGGRADWERSPRNFSSHQDDHYRSWRDRQMQALDRDYEDYCREREQQFHQDFDSWRRNRQQQSSGRGNSSEQVMELNDRAGRSRETGSGPSPMSEATLGSTNSENSDSCVG